MPNIKLTGVAKNYGTGPNALENLNLEVNDGDFMCLLGPSGCGKTTTVRMIAGLETASTGTIQIGDRVVDDPEGGKFVSPEQRNIGLVFQSYALWPHMTVGENIEYGLKLKKLPKSERQERVAEISQKLDISQHQGRYPSQLSGGQQQRVALARMLAVNPQLMLLDEPLSNLDSRLRLEMRAELKRIHNEFGSTIVFVTHDQWEAMTLATRVAVLHDGHLQQVGSPTDIYDRPANRFVANFLGNPPINFIERDGEPAGSEAVSQAGRLFSDADDLVETIGIRPESIILESADYPLRDTEFGFEVEVVSVLPTGGSSTIELKFGDRKLYATILNDEGIFAGSKKMLVVERAKLHLFDSAGERVTSTDG